jgi:hypothetical protein
LVYSARSPVTTNKPKAAEYQRLYFNVHDVEVWARAQEAAVRHSTDQHKLC